MVNGREIGKNPPAASRCAGRAVPPCRWHKQNGGRCVSYRPGKVTSGVLSTPKDATMRANSTLSAKPRNTS